MSDIEILQVLNRDYVASVQNGDVRRFDEILDDDFVCTNPDGTLVDRAAFLLQTAQPVVIRDLQAHDVLIRCFGDVAIIHARTSYTLPDGRKGAGRYTDVWTRQREPGQAEPGRGEHRQCDTWRAVSAHVTRA